MAACMWRHNTHHSTAAKKISAACFSIDSSMVFMADRFGDVTAAATATVVDPGTWLPADG